MAANEMHVALWLEVFRRRGHIQGCW